MGKAIGKAIEPTVTDLTNKAANAIDQAAQNTEQQVARSSGLEGAMAKSGALGARAMLPRRPRT